MGKKTSKLIPWLAIILLGFGLAYLNLNPCHLPTRFSIGQIDSRFGISKADVEKLATNSADRWNKAIGKGTLFYDPSAKFSINLVYDDRQANRDKLKTEVSGLNLANTDIGTVKQRLEKANRSQ